MKIGGKSGAKGRGGWKLKMETATRHRFYKQIDPETWEGAGISPANLYVLGLVLFSVVMPVLQSEWTIQEPAHHLLRADPVGAVPQTAPAIPGPRLSGPRAPRPGHVVERR